MAVSVHNEMHCDHQHRLSELAFCQEQINHWNHELQESLRNVQQIKGALVAHEDALRKHVDELTLEDKRLRQHEHALAEYERGGTGEDLVVLAQKHRDEQASQNERRAIHERIKRHHHSLMAQWQLLLGALTKPM